MIRKEKRTITKVETAVRKAIELAQNDSHGYSQAGRWGPDYDCSSLVCTVFEEAGIPLKSCGATYTGNMLSAALKAGFVPVPLAKRIRGDILLRHTSGSDGHTAIYLGNGTLVHAAGTYSHPESGDQSGNEICIQSYYDGGWQYCLRYPEEPEASEEVPAPVRFDPVSVSLPVLKNGDTGPSVMALQCLLNGYGYSVGPCGIDGEFGPDTEKALRTFQLDLHVAEDGKSGEKTWHYLLEGVE